MRPKPYFEKIARGLALGYRRTRTAGTWVVRVTGAGEDWTEKLGTADDHDETGVDILTYGEAQDRAKALARAGRPGADNSVKGALDRYEADLKAREAAVDNFKRARLHLSPKLANKSVGALTTNDLREWRNGLAAKMAAASVNRTANALRAALNLAAETDERIFNRKAWKDGLKALADASQARNTILSEQDVRAIVAGAYRNSDQFGEFVEVLAVTGARPSQAARLQGEDVQSIFDAKNKTWQPRLMMPTSRKGRGKKRMTHRPVPITVSLTERLANRKGTLLLRPDGGTWNKSNHARRFIKAVKVAGLDPAVVSIYALRHSSIARQLLANVPIRVVAALHDTSVAMIEKNYSKHIADHADELARKALLQTSAEVVPLKREIPV
jgi:integrase